MSPSREVVLYRMILPDHTCPYGVRATELLESAGVPFEDRILGSRGEVEEFKAKHQVPTTPQLFVDERRIGGSSEIEDWLAQEQASA
jgi:glutaredoxin